MKYWLLTTEYPPFYGGGISTYCRFTVEMMSNFGHQVTVFVQDDSISDYVIRQQNENVSIVLFNSDRHNLQKYMGYTARLSYSFAKIVEELIRLKGKPDVIESQDYLGIAYYLTQFKHLGYDFIKEVPILLTLHSPAFVYLEYNRVATYKFPDFWTCEMEKQAMNAADLLISPTQFMLEEVSRFTDINHKTAIVVPNPFSPPLHISPKGRSEKIIYYGKLSPQKGSFELLRYFNEMYEEGFNHPLHIIGGEDIVYHLEMKMMGTLIRQNYKHLIEKKLLVFHGKILPAEIETNIANASVVVVPSIIDNLPYVVIECMALGKIVLTSTQGGQREIINDGEDGFLFDHTIKHSFKSQLLKILSLSPEERGRIQRAAINKINNSYNFSNIYREKIKAITTMLHMEKASPIFPHLYQEQCKEIANSINNKQLSVVIPFFNMEPFVEEALQSIIQSDYANIEIIIINDGSTDARSKEWLKNYKHPSVKIIHQKNKGVAEARNLGARIANGEYLAFLDADDRVAITYFSLAIKILSTKDNVHFVGAWVRYFGESHAVWPTFTPSAPYILVHNSVNSSGLVYKRAAFLKAGLNDSKTDYGLEDYESVISMMHHGFNGVVIPEVLFFYRIRQNSMFRKINRNKLIYSNRYIVEKHGDYYEKFSKQVINLLNANGPGYMFDNPTLEIQIKTFSSRESGITYMIKKLVKRNALLKKMALNILRRKK